MAHNLTIREDGMPEFAFTGNRSAIWHGLGQELAVGAPLEEWQKQAGMDWEIRESPVLFDATDENGRDVQRVHDKKVLYRSDNHDALGIVSDSYHIVQPSEVIEFFRDLVDHHGLTLSTAGTILGGRKFWALAELGAQQEIVAGDAVKQHLLLMTSADGTSSTVAKAVTTRVVCNNTLDMALSEKNNRIARVTHKRTFNATDVKFDLKLIDEGWRDMVKNMRKLADTKLTTKQMREFYQELVFDPKKLASEQTRSTINEVNQLLNRAMHGSGSELYGPSAWAVLCGATEYYTHGTGRRDASNQFADSYAGNLSQKKVEVYDKLLAMAA